MKSTCFGKCSFRYPSEKRTTDPGAERPIPSRQLGCQPMGRAAGSSNLPNSSMKSTCFGKCFFRYPSGQRTADPGAERPIPSRQSRPLFCREAALTFLCGQRPHFFPSQREELPAPHSLFAAKRERAAGAVQETKRHGHQGSMSYTKREWAPGPQSAR